MAEGDLDGPLFKKSFLAYHGTLSHPPCSSVLRLLMLSPIAIQPAQLARLKQRLAGAAPLSGVATLSPTNSLNNTRQSQPKIET